MARVPTIHGHRSRSQQRGDRHSSTDFSALFLCSNPSTRPIVLPRNVRIDRPGAYYVNGRASGQLPAWVDNPRYYRSRSEVNIPASLLLPRSPEVEAEVHPITLIAANGEMREIQVAVPDPRQGRSNCFFSRLVNRLVKGRGIRRHARNASNARSTHGHNDDIEDNRRTRSEAFAMSPSSVESAQSVTTRSAEPSHIHPLVAQPPTRGGHAGRDAHSKLHSSLQAGTNRSSNFHNGPITQGGFIVETQGSIEIVDQNPEVTPSESMTIDQDEFSLIRSSIARNPMSPTQSSFRQQRRDPRMSEVLEIFPNANLKRVQELLCRHGLERAIMILASEQVPSVVITDNLPGAIDTPIRDSSDPRIGQILEIFPSVDVDLITELLRDHPLEAIIMVLAK